ISRSASKNGPPPPTEPRPASTGTSSTPPTCSTPPPSPLSRSGSPCCCGRSPPTRTGGAAPPGSCPPARAPRRPPGRAPAPRPPPPPPPAGPPPDPPATQVPGPPPPPAVRSGRNQLTYAELDARSDRLARLLLRRGAGPETIVALALPRCPELVTAMVAVLKAGATYLPVDLRYPAERIAFMIDDARPALVIT